MLKSDNIEFLSPDDAELIINAFSDLADAQGETDKALVTAVEKLRILAATAAQTERLLLSILKKPKDDTPKGDQ